MIRSLALLRSWSVPKPVKEAAEAMPVYVQAKRDAAAAEDKETEKKESRSDRKRSRSPVKDRDRKSRFASPDSSRYHPSTAHSACVDHERVITLLKMPLCFKGRQKAATCISILQKSSVRWADENHL